MRRRNAVGLAFVVAVLSTPAAAISPDAKTFVVTGVPPMAAIAVDALAPTNRQRARFAGTAALELAGTARLALTARLQHRRKRDTGVYRFASTAAGFPRFRATVVTRGQPEVVIRARLVLTRGRRDKITQTRAAGVVLASTATTTSVTTTTLAAITTTTLSPTPPTSGCFQEARAGTVRDTCTGLQWEKKDTAVGSGVDPSNPHDVDNRYTWSGRCSTGALCQPDAAAAAICLAHSEAGAVGCLECESGACDVDPGGLGAVTTVWEWLRQLNAAGFAGYDDWRLPRQGAANDPPTVAELTTIRVPPAQCGAGVCIDALFGPAVGGYWSATTSSYAPDGAWIVFFDRSGVNDYSKAVVSHVRAVRAYP